MRQNINQGKNVMNRANSAPKSMQSILKSNLHVTGKETVRSQSSRSINELPNKFNSVTDEAGKNSIKSKEATDDNKAAESLVASKISFAQRSSVYDLDDNDPSLIIQLDAEALVRELKHLSFDKKDPLPINIM